MLDARGPISALFLVAVAAAALWACDDAGGGVAGAETGGAVGAGGGVSSGGSAGSQEPASGGSAGEGNPSPRVVKAGETLLADDGLTIVSYGGYLNGESFQQEGILSYGGYQYTAYWNAARHVVLARRDLPDGAWSSIEFTDYENSADDAHNTISLGIAPGDGTLHLSFDHHIDDLRYRRSVEGLVTNPTAVPWSTASFSAVSNALVNGEVVTEVTYPRFVTEPGGAKLLFAARIGTSGSGDEHLWEYDSSTHTWTSLGRYLNGVADDVNAYPHGLTYTPGGTRLHVAWCWRATPDPSTNHGLYYAYSDDHGRTWRNDAGDLVATTGSSFITASSPGVEVWPIAQNRGLINQEHMTVDAQGGVHVLLSHLPDGEADDSNFTSARTKSEFFHYYRAPEDGSWTRRPLHLPVVENFRGKLAVASSGNVYAILPDLRIAGASAATNFDDWTLLVSDAGRFFSDPLIDAARLLTEDELTIVYPAKDSPNLFVLDYHID